MSAVMPTPTGRERLPLVSAPAPAAPVPAPRRRTSAHVPGVRATAERATVVVLGRMLYLMSRVMIRTARVTAVAHDEVLRYKAAGRRLLFVGWHGYDLCNLGVFPFLFGRDTPAVIMAPMTWEGRVMEQLARGFAYDVVPVGVDASSPISARGVVEMVSKMRSGCDGLIAVDGPSGPPEQAKLGAAVIAKRSGAVVVPTTVAGSLELRFSSRWDKHLVIPPLARMVVHFGPMIDTQPGEGPSPTAEAVRERIERALREGTARAREMAHDARLHG